MEISARSEYAIRALLMLAEAHAEGTTALPVATLARRQELPAKFLEVIMGQLRRGGLVDSRRGASGGYRLAVPADQLMIGAVLRTMDGPLTGVRGIRPSDTVYAGPAVHLPVVWVAARAALRRVLDEVSIQHVLTGKFPAEVVGLSNDPQAWEDRWPLQSS